MASYANKWKMLYNFSIGIKRYMDSQLEDIHEDEASEKEYKEAVDYINRGLNNIENI